MFRTGSPYSPFFTSGFLSSSSSSSSSRAPSPQPPISPRRGSLPIHSTHRSSTDHASAFYVTLQPKRDTTEYRSFLSLDLAESNSFRSASLKPRGSPASKFPSSSTEPLRSFIVFSKVLERPPSSPSSRISRDSLRNMPSPKPAPSITLPQVPTNQPLSSSSSAISLTPPRLPSISINTNLGISMDTGVLPLVINTHLPPASTHIRPNRRSTSTVSTRVRKVNRSYALARLEGRTNSTSRKRIPKPIKTNFMSMSDDEDDANHHSDPNSGQVDPGGDSRGVNLTAILEPEDLVFPTTGPLDGFPTSPTPNSASSRLSYNEDWFQLESFIDFQVEDDMSLWSKKSFVAVSF